MATLAKTAVQTVVQFLRLQKNQGGFGAVPSTADHGIEVDIGVNMTLVSSGRVSS